MGAEHSQQRLATDGSEFFEGIGNRSNEEPAAIGKYSRMDGAENDGFLHRRPLLMRSQTTLSSSSINKNRRGNSVSKNPGDIPSSNSGQELGRASSSPPLSICSDLPYVSYTANKPIGGDSPKMRGLRSQTSAVGGNKTGAGGVSSTIAHRSSLVLRRPTTTLGAKTKRPQTTGGLSDIVVVKANTNTEEDETEPEMQQLQNIPQFMPVIGESLKSNLNFSCDAELLERFKMQPHVLNICTRLQNIFHSGAHQVAQEQSRLVERTKVISNTSTRVFASMVDMQKTYAAYAEQFTKIRAISEELQHCRNLVMENMNSMNEINEFLPSELRLPAFNVWLNEERNNETTSEKMKVDDSANLIAIKKSVIFPKTFIDKTNS